MACVFVYDVCGFWEGLYHLQRGIFFKKKRGRGNDKKQQTTDMMHFRCMIKSSYPCRVVVCLALQGRNGREGGCEDEACKKKVFYLFFCMLMQPMRFSTFFRCVVWVHQTPPIIDTSLRWRPKNEIKKAVKSLQR